MENEELKEQTLNQKAISFATSDHYAGAVEVLKRVRTKLHSVIAENEFQTMVNALTLELESNMIQRFLVEIDSIRKGNQPNENVESK